MKEEKRYKFLQDLPKGKDLFEGQSQEKIASVLSDNIEKGEFQIIGIDGGWGTGKSNLVKIIETKLPSAKHKFFIYDVWGHQGDDQRKSILIELTDFITKEKQVKDTQKWNLKLEKLLAKNREITTKNYPYLSIGFIFSLLSIIYIPTINTLKDFPLIDKPFCKFLIVWFPILIVIGIYLWYLLKNWIKKTGFRESFKLSAQETFKIYTNKQTQETKIETISENEPSVRDFRGWMSEIDSDLILNGKTLIIVFDNFDRLPKENIQNIWSSIHLFFSEDKYKNIRVIIPFDRAHIKMAFSDLNGVTTNLLNDSEKVDFANDYINKTFDIVFRISPPIMTAWKNFFKKCWDEVFTNFNNDHEYNRVVQIYETYVKTITPRDIISFINEVVSIKLIHNDVPERFIGLFVANKDIILSNPLIAITDAAFLKGLEYLYKDSDDFQKYITALAYQIEPDNALEVIYKKQLKNSLVNNNIEVFIEISKTKVFYRVIISVFSEIDDFNNPIIVLNSLDEKSSITDQEKQLLWDDIFLRYNIRKREAIELFSEEKILLIHVSSNNKKLLIKRILHALINQTKEFDSIKYSNVIDELRTICEESLFDISLIEMLDLTRVSANSLLELVKEKGASYKNYKLKADNAELDSFLSTLDIPSIDKLDYIQHLISDYKLDLFSKTLLNKIELSKTDIVELSILLRVLKLVSISIPKIGIILDDSELYTLFASLNKDQDLYYDILAMRISRASEFQSTYKQYFTDILDVDDDEIAQKIAERIELYSDFGTILQKSILFTSNLTKNIVRKIVENSYQENRANILELIKSFDKICSVNDMDPQTLINKLNNWEKPKFDKALIESIPVVYFEEAVKNSTELAKLSIEQLSSYFDGLSKEEWKLIFNDLKKEKSQCLKIIQYNKWNSFALDAFKECLLSLTQTGLIVNELDWSRLILSFEMSGKDLTNTFNNIRDELIKNRNINKSQFLFFGKWLFKYANLLDKAGDVMRTILIPTLLDNEDCVNLMLENGELIKEILSKSNPSEAFDFKDALRDRFNIEKVKSLAKNLGIKERKKKEE